MQANELVQKALQDKEASESDIDCAPRLLDVILQCCKGQVDACIPSYIELCHQRWALADAALLCSAECPVHMCLRLMRISALCVCVSVWGMRWCPGRR